MFLSKYFFLFLVINLKQQKCVNTGERKLRAVFKRFNQALINVMQCKTSRIREKN